MKKTLKSLFLPLLVLSLVFVSGSAKAQEPVFGNKIHITGYNDYSCLDVPFEIEITADPYAVNGTYILGRGTIYGAYCQNGSIILKTGTMLTDYYSVWIFRTSYKLKFMFSNGIVKSVEIPFYRSTHVYLEITLERTGEVTIEYTLKK